MLTVRKTPRSENYYVRGTVHVGDRSRVVAEHTTKLKDKVLAEAYARQLENRIAQDLLHGDVDIKVNSTPLSEAFALWAAIEDPNYSLRSMARRLVDHLGEDKICGDITSKDWIAVRAELLAGKAPSTINGYKNVLRSLMKAAGVEALPTFAGAKKKKALDAKLPVDKANLLTESYCERSYGPALAARYGGLRAGEIACLKVADIDWSREQFVIRDTKNGEIRFVPIHPRLMPYAIASQTNKSGYVFEKTDGEPWPYSKDKLQNPFRYSHQKALKAAGIQGFKFHDWRHFFAFQYAAIDGNLRNLMEVGGWKNIKMLEIYLPPNEAKIAQTIGGME